MTGFNLVIALVVYGVLSAMSFYYKSALMRAVLITYTFVVASLVYFSFETYKGWPSRDLVTKGNLISVYIVDPRGSEKGGIYFWVEEERELTWLENLYVYVPSDMDTPPRAHYLPYSKPAAKKFQQAQQALESGMTVKIENMGKPPNNTNDNPPDGQQKQGTDEGNAGDADEYKVPHFQIVDPRQRLEKKQ